jgi:DNA polymerase II small subunit/DNA polymerase delta subunit B
MMEKMREDRTNFKNRRRDITTDPIDIEKIKNTIGTFTPFRRFIFLKRQKLPKLIQGKSRTKYYSQISI